MLILGCAGLCRRGSASLVYGEPVVFLQVCGNVGPSGEVEDESGCLSSEWSAVSSRGVW